MCHYESEKGATDPLVGAYNIRPGTLAGFKANVYSMDTGRGKGKRDS